MGTSPRIEVAWRRRVPARTLRYVAVLVVVGFIHAWLVAFGPVWTDPDGSTSLMPMQFLAWFLLPSTWIVGWFARGRIATARGAQLPILTSLLTLTGAWLTTSLFLVAGSLQALWMGDWGLGLVMLVFSWLTGAVFAVIGGWVFLPVGFASTWLAILVLRWAAGGVIERSRRAVGVGLPRGAP